MNTHTDAPIATTRIIQPSRLLGPFRAIGCVIVALIVSAFVIRWSGRPVPRWIQPADPTIENSLMERMGGKVATMIRQGWTLRKSEGPELGILIGSSTTFYGFDPAVLESVSRSPMRWINMGTDGGDAEDCGRVAQMVFQSGIKPAVIVLGLHEEMLPRTTNNCVRDPITLDLEDFKLHLSLGYVRAAYGDLCQDVLAMANRIFPRRSHTDFHFRHVILDAKIRAFHHLGVGLDDLFSVDPDAWSTPRALKRKPGITSLENPVISKKNFEAITDCGWFTAENYQLANPGPQAILRLMDECDRNDVRLVIVLTPKLGWLKKLLPVQSFECLDGVLEGRGNHRPEIIDLSDAIPERLFADPFHTDATGREVATRQLATFLDSTSRGRTGDRLKRPE